ncbi:MAG: hypothetical protein WD534_05395 [Phycisphaeraceae bacterium]
MVTPQKPDTPRACNIDARGRAVRLFGGLVTLAAGLALVIGLLAGVLAGVVWCVVAVVLLAGGAFQIYEARAGWCVLRAAGIRTPL